jgi:hypothetical protein
MLRGNTWEGAGEKKLATEALELSTEKNLHNWCKEAAC